MGRGWKQRLTAVLAFLAVVSALSGVVWRYGFHQGLDQLAARADADLALAGDRLVGQLQRYRDLAVTMAEHPQVVAALDGDATRESARILQSVADKSATLNLLVLDRAGRVRAAALPGLEIDLSAQPLIRRAMRGALGWGHGPAHPLTDRAFYHAAPIFGPAGQVRGALVVLTDLNGIDYNWRGTNPPAFFTDDRGVVNISNRSEILWWQRRPGQAGLAPPDRSAPRFQVDVRGGHEVWTVGWGPYLPRESLHLTQALPVIGMTGEVLLDVTPARMLARAQTAAFAALCLAFGCLLFFAAERRRTLAEANAQLEARVAERTAALRQAQDDLVQAGKLSALGQMSAGISHELNQPLMAIRSFAENAVQFLNRDATDRAADNLARISDMTQRMRRIIQNLRAFARQETVRQDRVELGAVLHTAVELTRTRLSEADVVLHYVQQQDPIWVRGGEVRLSQVFVNLITNALDAMATSPTRQLHIEVVEGSPVAVIFRDTGPGIEMPDKVFDPFYTTKQVGETGGMGLGLSISYGIVQSLGGQIKGANHADGGAVFTVTLEAAPEVLETAA